VAGFAGTVAVLVLPVLPTVPVSDAATPPEPAVDYLGTLYGDVALTGNTVTTCPARGGLYPAARCRAAQNRAGAGPAALNNAYPMRWADVDRDPATYDSSSGRLSIPDGARIVHAVLVWAGDTGEPASGACGRGTVKPPGVPRTQPVSVTIGTTTTVLRPQDYTEDPLATLPPLNEQFYRARADLGRQLSGVHGDVTITVGNVWTPQGFDCFGGWAVLAVWTFDHPHPPVAPARRQVTLYDADVRVPIGVVRREVRAAAIRPAGGDSRAGVIGFEGDWGVAGDRFLVNGYDPDRTGNFFVSAADGSLDPHYPNNMSVDVRTVDIPAATLKAGDHGAQLSFTTVSDGYLVAGLAFSTPMPELTAITTVAPAIGHAGDAATQTVQVTDSGGAPLAEVRVQAGLAPGCEPAVPHLNAGETVTLTCTGTLPAAGGDVSASVTAQSLTGDPLAAQARTSVQVLNPAIEAGLTIQPSIVLSGQALTGEISIHDTGNTALSHVDVSGCAAEGVGTLAAGATATVRCSLVAGDRDGETIITVSGTDPLGKQVTARAHATVTVAHPRVTLAVRPSTRAAPPGRPVTIAVTVANPSTVPLRDVEVTGTPASCVHSIGTLAAGGATTYACTITAGETPTIALAVTATPALEGLPPTEGSVRDTATAIVAAVVAPPRHSVNPAFQPPRPVAPPAAQKGKPRRSPLRSPVPVVALVAGLAVLTNFVTMNAIAATAARPGK
jgi:hypothetical protein